ncbi:trypsin-like serine peptidase [Iodobacter fluviatilis]|uniref:Protease YdgD n=1 Tax=Iodobacter fluviatilis TaxID=537 RepID=A0A377SVK0_9NEIS|nr:trypsin-like serine protease [Iodobacter fluviatilis]TCU87905.1 protease YdgD [Iodobacter fluviatilis]STR45405.1 V8-like Glu-specific endopeptidase [Iodobacter fluviatilis]
MKRRYLIALVIALSSNAFALSNKEKKALFFGADNRVFIEAPYAAPFAAIGQLETAAASTCTATLVAPDLAITAAHCFLMDAKKLDAGRWFKAGFHKGEYQARYQVLSQTFHPRFKKGLVYKGDDVYIQDSAAAYDIAWLKLKLIDGKAPAPLALFSGNKTELKAGIAHSKSLITQAGFAEDHDTELTAHKDCKLTRLRTNNTIYHRCDTLAGDSGSPIWINTASGPQIIAVQSSAPDWFNRKKADNVGVTVLQLPPKP